MAILNNLCADLFLYFWPNAALKDFATTPCIFLYRTSFYCNHWFAFSPNLFVFLFIFVHLARFCRNFAFEGGSAMLLH